jgi:hypothetical protein
MLLFDFFVFGFLLGRGGCGLPSKGSGIQGLFHEVILQSVFNHSIDVHIFSKVYEHQ